MFNSREFELRFSSAFFTPGVMNGLDDGSKAAMALAAEMAREEQRKEGYLDVSYFCKEVFPVLFENFATAKQKAIYEFSSWDDPFSFDKDQFFENCDEFTLVPIFSGYVEENREYWDKETIAAAEKALAM